MKIEKSINKTTLSVSIEGRLDTLTSPAFEEEIRDDLDSVNKVIMECENLEYTTSAGLRVILEIQQAMEDKGGFLKMRNVNKAIMEVLEFTGFLEFIVIE